MLHRALNLNGFFQPRQQLDYTIRKVQENQKGFELTWIHQFMVYVNLMGKNINTLNKNTDALSDTSKEVDLEVNAEKTTHIVMSHHHNAAQNHNI
jgi:hypothetical protein